MANAVNKNKDVVLKGIGKFYAVGLNTGRSFYSDKGQKMTMTINTESSELYGGDGKDPIYVYATKCTTEFSFTNAVFKMSQLGILMDSIITEEAVQGTNIAKITKTTKSLGEHLTNVKVKSASFEDGSTIGVKEGSSADESGIAVSTDGAVTFGASTKEGEYIVVYSYDATGVQVLALNNDLAEPVKMYIVFEPDTLKGEKKRLCIEVYKAIADGNLTIETARDSASTPEIKFKTMRDETKEGLMKITLTDIPTQGE